MLRIGLALVVSATSVTLCSGSSSNARARPVSTETPLLQPASSASSSASSSAFSPIRQSGEEAVCGLFLPPRLVTINGTGAGDSIFKLDVIVGEDGAVESVLILEDGGRSAEPKLTDRVSRWVYKPALCNGVPVAAEGQIEVRGE